ncbi:MAG: trypsin-like peptidase domain-containing protein [Gammaproteobacteria bacterium]|nr:trypsin-like peptidase domain-containing protein [Gammaproteobacteria bacterium]MCP5423835.1 trypsin-like peptidase domain-containing protein [Gammaproteobacteria bacterium]
MTKTLILILPLTIALIVADTSLAQIYKYQDARGKWHFTDRPPAGQAQDITTVTPSVEDKQDGKDLKATLSEKYPPQTPVQEATLATVMIKTPLGTGSGFFVSEAGHILTNKHVIIPSETQLEDLDNRIAAAEQQYATYREQLEFEEARLEKRKKDLATYKNHIRSLGDGPYKRSEQENYDLMLKQSQLWEKSIAEKRREFREKQAAFDKEQRDFNWKRHVTSASRRYIAVLKDGTEMNVRQIAVSKDHDLALLQLDGFRTPRLEAATRGELGQGVTVYALGNPIGIHDSISAGVVSGFEDYYVRTDAKIYPGNSGGPLILEDGRVIGINTMKRISQKFEGIGYAIDIDTALANFASYLPKKDEQPTREAE